MDGRSLLPLLLEPTPPAGAADELSAGAAADEAAVAAFIPPPKCTPDPCHGHGVCLAPLKPQCYCDGPYAGQFCERCAAGHEGYPACRCASTLCNCRPSPALSRALVFAYKVVGDVQPGAVAGGVLD